MQSLRLFFYGMCMGACDLIPGISGGTIALLMGFYPQLIESIKSIEPSKLFQLKVGAFFKSFPAKFLVPLLSGALISMAIFSKMIHWILNQELYRSYFYGAFFGLILASAFFCMRQIKVWKMVHLGALTIGLILAYLLTGSFEKPLIREIGSGWLIFSGAVAICAMLLPGISGSYILTILGVYEKAIAALVDLTKSVQEFGFDVHAFSILAYIALGIIAGALVFCRFLSWLLKHYEQSALAFLTGTMLGAVKAVWPFWIYEHNHHEKGIQLVPQDFYVPEWHSALLWKVIFIGMLAFMSVFVIEWVASTHKKAKPV